jgi:hypothetical protein
MDNKINGLLATIKETGVLCIDATNCEVTKRDIIKILKTINYPIHTISLHNYRVGNPGAIEIARLLTIMPIIQLSLFVDSIDSRLVDIANTLYFNRTLKFLHICCIEINNTQCEALVHMLQQNTSLESMILDSNNLTNGNCCAIINQLKNNTQLKSLVIQNNDIATKAIVTAEKMLRINRKLIELTLRSTKTNRTANLAIKISGLRQDPNKQINKLCVEKIYIDQCYGSLIDIILNTRVFDLDLFITDTDVMNFLIILFNNQKIMINLIVHILNRCSESDVIGTLKILKRSGTIKSLDLSNNCINDMNRIIDLLVDIIKNSQVITILNLSGLCIGNNCSKIFEAVEYNANISELYLSNCGINMLNIDYIVKFLKIDNRLEILDLSCNNDNWRYTSYNFSNSIINIFDSLINNHTLHVLYFNNNKPKKNENVICCGNNVYIIKIISAIIKCLETNYTLTELGISGVNEAIDYGLTRNKNYQSEQRFIRMKPVQSI